MHCGEISEDVEEEVNEATAQYVGVVLDTIRPRISCQDVLLQKIFDLNNKPKSRI
jgi:hypothetical protein